MSDEVKCPQCGGNCCVCHWGTPKEEWDTWLVHCQDCNLKLKQLCHTKEKAIETWNNPDVDLKDGWGEK